MKLWDKIWTGIFAIINIAGFLYIFLIAGGPGVDSDNIKVLFRYMSIPIVFMAAAIMFLLIDGTKVPSIETQRKAWFERFILVGLALFTVNAAYLLFYATTTRFSPTSQAAKEFAIAHPLLVGVIIIAFLILFIKSYSDQESERKI